MMLAEVKLWGRTIGAVSWNEAQQLGYFEYDKAFIESGIEVAPFMMPLSPEIYAFPHLPKNTFYGLPGLLADSLPDAYGHKLIDAWLVREGRTHESFTPVERLCYIGTRGMGALEYYPLQGPKFSGSKPLEVAALVELASQVLTHRYALHGSFKDVQCEHALRDILQVGTSAGGARAKAIIAWNETTNEVRSGQVPTEKGFSYWLLKFDGVSGNKDKELEDPKNYGLIEYAYYHMARAAGIQMEPSRLLRENGRRHFMTKRFDRNAQGKKLHMQTLGAIQHYDYNQPGAYSYEQALQTIRVLDLGMLSLEEQFRRMVFNIVARNQDDHVKNIAFLMDKSGTWSLAPAYDITYSYNPQGIWTSQHQMSLNGKRDHFVREDFFTCAQNINIPKSRVKDILNEVITAVRAWPDFARQAEIDEIHIQQIAQTYRLNFL